MEILTFVCTTIVLATVAGSGLYLTLNAPNSGGPGAFIIGLVMFISACSLETALIEYVPCPVETECTKEAK